MVDAVLEAEAPLREDILAQCIARAHGWLRTGSRIREQVLLHLKDVDRTEESSGDFIWKKGTVSEFIPYRAPEAMEFRRSISDIPLAELAYIVRSKGELLDESDPALSLARFLGVERLAATSRERLDEAISRATQAPRPAPEVG